jgi:hypothetical protein
MASVNYEQMVEYVSVTVARIEQKLDESARQFRGHETYHRDLLANEIQGIQSAKLAWWGTAIAALIALASLAVTIISLVAIH